MFRRIPPKPIRPMRTLRAPLVYRNNMCDNPEYMKRITKMCKGSPDPIQCKYDACHSDRKPDGGLYYPQNCRIPCLDGKCGKKCEDTGGYMIAKSTCRGLPDNSKCMRMNCGCDFYKPMNPFLALFRRPVQMPARLPLGRFYR